MMEGSKLSGRVRFGIAIAVLAILSMATPAASGAVYVVHACRLPNGAAAPANGWSVTTGAIATVNCPGGVITARTPSGTTSPGWRYGIEFVAPKGTSIVSYDRRVEGNLVQVAGGPPPWSWDYLEGGTFVGSDAFVPVRASGNTGPFSHTGEYPLPNGPLSRLLVVLACSNSQGSGPCQNNGSNFNLRQIAVTLNDPAPPRILAATGSLLTGKGPLRGQLHLALKLSDTGGGLYRTRLLADDERVEDRVIDDNQGACRMPFVLPVPCKLAASVDVPIDTTRLTEGTHAITVRVLDATGVNSAVVGPVTIVVDNLADPPIRGTAACPTRSAATVRRTLKSHTVRYGRAALITGRVVGSKALLKGAHVGVVDNPAIAPRSRLARVRNHGRFRIKVRPRQSTEARPILVSASGVAQACGRPVKLAVRAGVRLRTAPRQLRNGQSIRMRGRVAAVRLPKQGKSVAIQARARGAGSWTTVTLMRTDPAGHFNFAYRFRKTFQTTAYEFRAVVPRERGYPFHRGWSRIRRATVSP
jgi:hypothetical protein